VLQFRVNITDFEETQAAEQDGADRRQGEAGPFSAQPGRPFAKQSARRKDRRIATFYARQMRRIRQGKLGDVNRRW
jgi:hypothetical protein